MPQKGLAYSSSPGARNQAMRSPKKCLVLSSILVSATAWLLRRVERDYEERGRLSPGASTAGWTLYILHAVATLSAARRSSETSRKVGEPPVAVGSIVALLGSVLYTTSVRQFGSVDQVSGREAGELVTSGPYRFSRNPQIIGWALSLGGISLASRSRRALLLVAAFFVVHELYLPVEERHLERTFGEEYRSYLREVPRYLGLPRQGREQ